MLACKNCIFMDSPVIGDKQMFVCRRYPPAILESEDKDGKIKHVSRYPYVNPEASWCGEFVSKQSVESSDSSGKSK